MIIDLLILLIAVGVYFSRPEPWGVVLKVLVAALVIIWLARLLLPQLVP